MPQGIKTRTRQNSPNRTANNHALTTTPDAVTKVSKWKANSLQDGLQAVLVRRVTGKELKAFRNEFALSARGMAQHLNYSRAYVKRVEGNSLRASAKFSDVFFAMRAEWANAPKPEPKPLVLIGPGTLAEDVTTIVLTIRPRRCQLRTCHTAFVPRDRKHKFCSDACRDQYARRKSKKK